MKTEKSENSVRTFQETVSSKLAEPMHSCLLAKELRSQSLN